MRLFYITEELNLKEKDGILLVKRSLSLIGPSRCFDFCLLLKGEPL
jgi:hypothetical protein